jgi:hypothetical protein
VEPARRTGRRRAWLWYSLWFAAGALLALGIVTAASIGLFVLPVGVVACVLLARRADAREFLWGAVSGAGAPLLVVAYVNRHGPGTRCTALAGGGTDCLDNLNPWPWLVAGVVIVVVGIVAQRARNRRYGERRRAERRRQPGVVEDRTEPGGG